MGNVKLDHLIVCDSENSVFAAARERDTRKVRLFLIKECKVYRRNGRLQTWEEQFGSAREDLVNHISVARNNGSIPVFHVNSLNA